MAIRGADWKPALSDPEVQTYLFDEVGEEGLEMAEYLHEHKAISGVDILEFFAERKASDVRKVLYKMMQAHAAEYEKDTDASGWETFVWNLDLPEIGLIMHRRWADEKRSVAKQLKFEEDHLFYACPAMHRRIVFEDAMDVEFHCPKCAEGMNPLDNNDVVAQLQERLDELASVKA